MTRSTAAVPQDRTAPPPAPTDVPRYHPRHRGLRLAGAALVGLLAVGLAGGTVPEMVRDSAVQSFALPAGTEELRIVGDVGDVHVRGVTDAGTGISADKHWSFREPRARMDTTGGTTTVTMDCPGLPVLGQCYADWDVSVPEDLTVVVRTSVGDVDATALTGRLEVRSSVGQVTVAGSPSTLDVSTSVGDVDAVLRAPADRVRVRTSVGDVELSLPDDVAYAVTADSMEPADVQVPTSPTSGHAVEVESSVGSILISGS